MQNNVDFSRFSILDEEVLKKTRRLGKYYAYCQINRQKVELSLFYLWKIIPEQDHEALGRISQIFGEVENLQNAQLIWARLCVAARFFYHDGPTWQNLLFSKLEERIILPDLTTDIQTATALLDTYFANLSTLKAAATKPATTPQQPAAPASKPKPEEVFACGSASTSKTLNPELANATPRLTAVVVFPTPPFWLAMAITLHLSSNDFSSFTVFTREGFGSN